MLQDPIEDHEFCCVIVAGRHCYYALVVVFVYPGDGEFCERRFFAGYRRCCYTFLTVHNGL